MNYKESTIQKIWQFTLFLQTLVYMYRCIKSGCVHLLVYSINTLGCNTGLKSVQPIQHSRVTWEMRQWSEELAKRVNEISLGLLEYKDEYSGQRMAAYENTSRTELNGHTLQRHMGHRSQIKKKNKIKKSRKLKQSEWNWEGQAWSMKGTE